jgi:hypothetical protein
MNLHESIVCIKALAEWRRRNINSSYRHAAQSAQNKILSQVREALDGVAVEIQRAATMEEEDV